MKKTARNLVAFVLAAVMVCIIALPAQASNAAVFAPVFDSTYYAEKYADLRAVFGTDEALLFNHFLTCGMAEGRQGSAEFNVFVYQEKYADLRAAFGDDLVSYYMHYITNGKAEGRTATGGASGSSGAAAPTATTTTSTAGSTHPMFTDAQWAYANEVIALVNQQRAAYGLGPVTATYELSSAAQARAVETVTLFSHTRPNGSSCFSIFPTYGVSYRCAGENIAAGQDTPAEVVNAWMNSPGHRANILNGSFNHMGVGCYNANTIYGIYWTQMFTN